MASFSLSCYAKSSHKWNCVVLVEPFGSFTTSWRPYLIVLLTYRFYRSRIPLSCNRKMTVRVSRCNLRMEDSEGYDQKRGNDAPSLTRLVVSFVCVEKDLRGIQWLLRFQSTRQVCWPSHLLLLHLNVSCNRLSGKISVSNTTYLLHLAFGGAQATPVDYWAPPKASSSSDSQNWRY